MTRVVIVDEIPVSYSAGWYRHVRDSSQLDLHVVYLAEDQPDRPWESKSPGAQDWVRFAGSLKLGSTKRGHFPRLSIGLTRHLDELEPDLVVVPGWAHPACLQLAFWCRRRQCPMAIMGETWKPQRETRIPHRVTTGVRSAMLGHAAVAMPAGLRAGRFIESVGDTRVHVVHTNTCDSESIARATAGVERSPVPLVTFVGRLMEHKGSRLLAEIADKIGKENVVLQVIGQGPDRSLIERLSGSAQNVRFLGPLPPAEVHRSMAESWAIVVPSLKEPWGVVLHEGLSAGTAVVATDEVGSAEDLLLGSKAGLIVDATAAALSGALLEVVRQPPSADVCRAQATTITYKTAAAEFEEAVAIGVGIS